METLYHYCSTYAFHAIASHKVIWLSSLSLSNDTMEGKLVAAAVTRLAERDRLDQNTTRQLIESIEDLELLGEGLGFCLSEEADLLSQWRGYAEDATGVAVGFSNGFLDSLGRKFRDENIPSFQLGKVVYEADAQDEHVQPTYAKAKGFIEKGAYKLSMIRGLLNTRTEEEVERDRKNNERAFRALHMTLFELFPKLFLLKSYGFREEREWRLIGHVVRGGKDSCLYRAVTGRVIPYREYDLSCIEGQPINEVVLGPKHLTPIHLVEGFLRQNGLSDVKVRRSEATYR